MLKKTDQKGQSLVEFAIALPLLILILAGILDLGRAYFTFIALTDAAAEGAAYAALHPTNEAQIIERAADASNGLVVVEPEMVNVISADLSPGNPITVTVELDYEILTPIMSSFVPDGNLRMRAVVVQPIINQ